MLLTSAEELRKQQTGLWIQLQDPTQLSPPRAQEMATDVGAPGRAPCTRHRFAWRGGPKSGWCFCSHQRMGKAKSSLQSPISCGF